MKIGKRIKITVVKVNSWFNKFRQKSYMDLTAWELGSWE